MPIPGKPVACNFRLLWLNKGLLWGIVACDFRLLGVPGLRAPLKGFEGLFWVDMGQL